MTPLSSAQQSAVAPHERVGHKTSCPHVDTGIGASLLRFVLVVLGVKPFGMCALKLERNSPRNFTQSYGR